MISTLQMTDSADLNRCDGELSSVEDFGNGALNAGEATQWVMCLAGNQGDPSSLPGTHVEKLCVTVHTYNPSAGEAEQRQAGPGACWSARLLDKLKVSERPHL